jgi:hypothetical protein
MKTFNQFMLELTQPELDKESSSINQNTRNAPIQRQQPPSQPDGTPQRPTGVPIPGTRMAFNTVKKVGQAAVGSVLNR